jgi:tetratricopeptide (TPR) repeat protein
MGGERQGQVERVYLAALKQESSQRAAFVAEACEGDESLRRKVEALLAQDASHEHVLGKERVDQQVPSTLGQSSANLRRVSHHARLFSPGSLLAGRFRIVRHVGSGGMGLVYEAVDEKLNRHVALKCAWPGYRNHLPPEVRAAREVSHFNVCKVHDLHTASTPEGEMEFVSMEFIAGETLAQRIDREGALAKGEAQEIARQVCAGLAQAHRQGVIHGDLKCSNVILARSPAGSTRAVITDFGLARINLDGDATMGGAGGTPPYMAPELLRGEPPSVSSDIYALGMMFYVMLTGQLPQRVRNRLSPVPATVSAVDPQASTISRPLVADQPWRTFRELPSPWRKVVTRCLARRSSDRFRSSEAVGDALRPRRYLLKASAVAMTAAAVALVYWILGPKPPPVRLAVLPFSVEAGTMEGAAGIGLDIADRLSGARRNFIVISPRAAERNHVDTPQKAKSVLGATHALVTRLHRSDGEINVNAWVTDLSSGLTLGEPLVGTYEAGDAPAVAKALIATVTGAFRLREAVPKESVSGPAYSDYVQGIEALRQDAYNADQAIAHLNKAIELDPKSALPLAGLADAQIQKFRKGGGSEWLERAGANVAKAKMINPDSVPVLLASGSFQQEHGSYEHAIRDFTRATELDPNNGETWQHLAGAYDKANRTNEAIATYRKAIEAEPSYYRNYLELGNLYWYRSQFREAEELYRRVTQIAPRLSTGHMNLGLALMEEGRFQEAEGPLLEALHLRKSSELLMNIGGLYYAEERYREAAPFFEESIASGPLSSIQYRDLGDVYRHLGRKAEAADAYRSAARLAEEELTRNPRDADPRIQLALVSAFLGDGQRAQAEAAQALAMEPDNAIVIREAAIMYEVLGQRESTLRLLQNAPKRLLEELSRHPDVKALQKDPRFLEMLQKQLAR